MNGQTLETELRARVEQGDERANDLWPRYESMRTHLEQQYYPWVQANAPFFTDHGKQHVRSVIDAAGGLLRARLADPQQTTSLDLFLLLSGIIWHDAGMVLQRSNHAGQVAQVTEQVKALGFPDPSVHRVVCEISQAHSGGAGLRVPRTEERCLNCVVYPRALAALVRFADEISESRNRISQALISQVPEDQRIYWQYANAISASMPDPARERVVVDIELQRNMATQRFMCGAPPLKERTDAQGRISLIEYVLCRLEKMNNERAYCSPEFGRYATVREVEARFTICDGVERIEKCELSITLGDAGLGREGYPSIPVFQPFFEQHPDWHPDRLKEVLGL
jgi:hypothetical protein